MPAAAAALGARDYGAFRERLAASGCQRCALAERRTRIVVDRGNPEARAIAVGEAPGAAEDASGRAFCGRSGQLLDRLCKAAGIRPERDLLIVNVVKCRPPGNRTPRSEEVAACRPFLDHQFALSPARVVALLGATALRRFAPERAKGPLGAQVGRFFRLPQWPSYRFIALYHPAAILYNRSLEPRARRHLETLARDLAAGPPDGAPDAPLKSS